MEIMGGVLIEGCKWCGKSTTGLHHAKSIIEFQNPDKKQEYDEIKNTKPSLFLNGKKPRMFDEWQMYPVVWDSIRTDVDHTGLKGQYILTGSARPSEGETMHTGTGRISRVLMRPMSLFESGDSTGDVSLKELCDNKLKEKLTGEVDLRHLAGLIIRGGWPANIDYSPKDSSEAVEQYLKLIIEDDLIRLDGVNRDKHKVKLLLKSLARNESTTVSNMTLKKDISDVDNEDIDIDTLTSYLNALDKLYLLDNDEPFSSNIRSSIRVKQSEKRHFADPSIACALLNLTEEKLINDLNTFGFMFEAMVERDLKIYADSFDAKCYHYQDYLNREIDSVIELEDGNWCAFEVKLGVKEIDNAAKNLVNIKKSIEKENGKAPSILCVICGMSNAAYQRPDGVYVVPITALKN